MPGHLHPFGEIVKLLIDYKINVLTSDATQLMHLARFISSLPPKERDSIKITKIIYTSETLLRPQQAFLESVFGGVQIFSIMGSAEAGAWCVSNTAITGERLDDAADFIFDTRSMIVEVHQRAEDTTSPESKGGASVLPCPEGVPGSIVVTSLQKLRNPLVRYVTGDIGSVHDLPATADVPADIVPHLKVLRLRGRDQRLSFKWQGDYFDLDVLQSAMQHTEWGVLQWQILLTRKDEPPVDYLELRILKATSSDSPGLSQDQFVQDLENLFYVLPQSQYLFQVTFVGDAEGFERSRTGNKIIKFVDWREA